MDKLQPIFLDIINIMYARLHASPQQDQILYASQIPLNLLYKTLHDKLIALHNLKFDKKNRQKQNKTTLKTD